MSSDAPYVVTFALPKGIEADDGLLSTIRKSLPFVTANPVAVDYDSGLHRLTLTAASASKSAEMEQNLLQFLQDITADYMPACNAVVAQSSAPAPRGSDQDIYRALKTRGWLMEIGQGFVGFRGPALMLFRALDTALSEVYATEFDAESVRFPSLISAQNAADCGYFASYPHHINMVTHLAPDYGEIEAFRQRHGQGEALDDIKRDSLAVPHVCLNPAACLCCYPQYRAQRLARGEVIQWLGRVHRFEASNLLGLERLWEYNVREIVFLGLPEFAEECRERAMKHLQVLFRDLELSYRVETATDPFFAPVRNEKTFFQSAMQTKFEIVMPVGDAPGQEIAIGSLNLHRDFFAGKYDIRTRDSAVAHTACVGIGIERLILAVLYQHGLNPEEWPEPLQSGELRERNRHAARD